MGETHRSQSKWPMSDSAFDEMMAQLDERARNAAGPATKTILPKGCSNIVEYFWLGFYFYPKLMTQPVNICCYALTLVGTALVAKCLCSCALVVFPHVAVEIFRIAQQLWTYLVGCCEKCGCKSKKNSK